jgi:MYXO-CTERM domain-containing protein
MRSIRSHLPALFATSAAGLCFPAAALACGGLFCNNSTPVVQQQESILFAVDGGTTHMHVRIVYAGPPQEFGWLLPVPRGVETTLSSEGILGALDAFQASFGIGEWERQVECEELPPPPEGQPGSNADAGIDGGGGGVQVLSREPVGPYDRAILDARTVEDLRTWLDANGYQIPAGTDDKLRPYVDQGAVFVAIKLLPGEDVGDIVPLHLSFPGDAPTIPIVPTSVAAAPDLGLAVHLLGQSRAVPLNYLHVQINEAAIDWRAYGPSNYTAVVAQAADEAGGQAFATDFAGRLTDETTPRFWVVPDDLLARLADVHTIAELGPLTCELNLFDPDIARLLRSILLPPDFEGGQEPTFLDCAGPVANPPDEVLDGAALAERVRVEINTPRTEVAGLFASQPYLTRFTSSMSAEEMTEDPAFAFNPDLVEVSNVRQATGILYQCDADGYYDYGNIKVRTPSGLLLDYSAGVAEADIIARDRGMTIRQGAEPGAAVIERLPLSGPAVIQEDRTAEIAARHAGSGGASGSGGSPGSGGSGGDGTGTGGSTGGDGTGAGGQAIGEADAGNGTVTADVGGDSGCGCRTTGRGGLDPAAFGLLALLGLARRRVRSRR